MPLQGKITGIIGKQCSEYFTAKYTQKNGINCIEIERDTKESK